MISLWWLRRDLRLADNPALQAALKLGAVIPVFILDPHLLARTPERRQQFLLEGLAELDRELRRRGSALVVRRGRPEIELLNLLLQTGAAAIFAEEDYTPYARRRDAKIAEGLPLTLVHGQTVHHPAAVLKPDGRPYTVFTPFSKTWKALLPFRLEPLPAPEYFPPINLPASVFEADLPSAFLLPKSVAQSAFFPAGAAEAQNRLAYFVEAKISQYADQRNRLDLEGTSALSPYLRFGMLSPRQAVSAALAAPTASRERGETEAGAATWLNELIWREFYISILYHFPRVASRTFNPALQNIPWREDSADFQAWQAGRTGMPVVDAAMRQLKATGWMHNRARMIVASFLVKDLLINWQWGERWFMDNLLDGDPAANNGGWQWVAGTGTDAAPYFRIFNPILQGQKFDPEGVYLRQWLSELADLPTAAIHAPWEKGFAVPGYPSKPIVDREQVKARTLAAYSQAKAAYAGRD